jgi:hypothetical protein
MKHAFKFCLLISAVLGMGDRALAQCFVCSDTNRNTAVGTTSLYSNSTGDNNTAVGFDSLTSNSAGYNNNAAGFAALFSNTSGFQNNASGVQALYSNTTASNNNAMGFAALFKNSTGIGNSAVGSQTLYHSTTGNFNDAVGYLALFNNTSGSNNVAIGLEAGYNQTTGSNNIYIGHNGIAAESGITRIGTPGTQTATYIAGIENAKVTGSVVYVTSSGQLGVLASSERYKTAIEPMGMATGKLQQLQPVSFRLKTDPAGTVQYGLIAEQADKVYPELVVRDESGVIQGVRYDELAPMLLNEMQQLKRQVVELKRANQSMRAAMAKLAAKSEPAAMR